MWNKDTKMKCYPSFIPIFISLHVMLQKIPDTSLDYRVEVREKEWVHGRNKNNEREQTQGIVG